MSSFFRGRAQPSRPISSCKIGKFRKWAYRYNRRSLMQIAGLKKWRQCYKSMRRRSNNWTICRVVSIVRYWQGANNLGSTNRPSISRCSWWSSARTLRRNRWTNLKTWQKLVWTRCRAGWSHLTIDCGSYKTTASTRLVTLRNCSRTVVLTMKRS